MTHQLRTAVPQVRVVHSVPGAWLPITQNWLYNQVFHLPNEIESHVVCQRLANADVFPTYNVRAVDDQSMATRLRDTISKSLRLRRHSSLLERTVRQVQPDILHSHFGNVACDNIAVARKFNVKHIVTFYGLDVNYLPQRGWMGRYQRMFREIDLVLCEGPHMASRIVELGCPKRKVQVHRLGVNVDSILFQPRQWRGDEPLRILLAAEFREKKGLPDALESIGRFHNQTRTPIEVTIIGDAGSSAASQIERQRVVEVIAKHKLQNIVRMLGYQPYARLMQEAAAHHVFIHPSVTAADGQTEGGAPVVLLDMAAAGVPIISTQHCDIPEIVIPRVTGLLAAERDPQGLAEQLAYFAQNQFACAAMTRNARKHIEQHFHAPKQGAALAARYQRLLGLVPLSASTDEELLPYRIAA